MFKEVFDTIISLILRPDEAWKQLSEKKSDDFNIFMSRYLYPVVGMMAAAALVGTLFARKGFDVQNAIKNMFLMFLSSLGGFFLAAYLLNEIWRKYFDGERNIRLWQRFVGYSSALIFALNIILSLLPDIFFLRIFVLYSFRIIWEGAIPYMGVKEKEQMKFSVISTVVILATPIILEFVIGMFMPGLRS